MSDAPPVGKAEHVVLIDGGRVERLMMQPDDTEPRR